jgi:hypothetical protein
MRRAWLRLCCFVGQPILAAAALQAALSGQPPRQEDLRLNLHCAWVILIFPQESAIVSNARSQTNAGFV